MSHHTHTQMAHVQAHASPPPPIELFGTPALTFAIIAALMIVVIYINRWVKNVELQSATFEVKSEK